MENEDGKVLILVVMEEGQRHNYDRLKQRRVCVRLNPCCNGRGSKTPDRAGQNPSGGRKHSLNPCCNGRGSKTDFPKQLRFVRIVVLILVVMEEGQRPYRNCTSSAHHVLILVVMEEGQRLVCGCIVSLKNAKS